MNNPADQSKSPVPAVEPIEMLEAYRQMLRSLFVTAGSVVAFSLAITLSIHFFGGGKVDPPIAFAVGTTGVLGALFSALMRLYNVRDLPKALLHPDLKQLRNKDLLMYSMVPILMGFIAAIAVYFAAAGGIVSGAFFPEFECHGDGDCNSFTEFFKYGPKAAPDYAKAIVMGFASGFSERLVSGVLGSVESSTQKSEG
jgi:hypothetical protein